MPEFSGVNIYEIPVWVKSFFVTRFPRMLLQHEGTHLLRGLLAGSTYKLKMVLSLQENHFILAAIKESEIKYYNTFEYQTVEDVIYHVAHLLQQNNWTEDDGTLSKRSLANVAVLFSSSTNGAMCNVPSSSVQLFCCNKWAT